MVVSHCSGSSAADSVEGTFIGCVFVAWISLIRNKHLPTVEVIFRDLELHRPIVELYSGVNGGMIIYWDFVSNEAMVAGTPNHS